MFGLRFLLQFIILLNEPIFAVIKRVVDTSLLDLSISAFSWLNEFVRRPACRLLELIEFIPDRIRAFFGKAINLASLAQLLYLLVLIPRNVVMTIATCKVLIFRRMGRNTIQGITKTVIVLGLNVYAIYAIINRIKASEFVRSRWDSTVQCIYGAADSHMNLFCNLAMLGGWTTKDVFWRSHKITDALYLSPSVQEIPILSLYCFGEPVGPMRSIKGRPCSCDLRGYMRSRTVCVRLTHSATSALSSWLSERM